LPSRQFIYDILVKEFGEKQAVQIIDDSPLIGYLYQKTKSIGKSSKARPSFANLYALYVLIEDYINKGYLDESMDYSSYDGAMFSALFQRQRELPFGEKLQNHALNNRCNDEFRKFFNQITDETPIIRNLRTLKYWINEKLLFFEYEGNKLNLAKSVIEIIDKYIYLKKESFNSFIDDCVDLRSNFEKRKDSVIKFVKSQLNPSTDARTFEIVSFVIVKYFYEGKFILFGEDKNSLKRFPIKLFKTGRTNANDGGIDFVMKPFGRFFQVTEVIDFKKYFLDIDKLNKFPISFVVKTNHKPKEVMEIIFEKAVHEYKDKDIVKKYIDCFEEIITLPTLFEYLDEIIRKNKLAVMLEELIIQAKVEFFISD